MNDVMFGIGGDTAKTGARESHVSLRMGGEATGEWRQHWSVVLASIFGIGLVTVYLYSTGMMIAPLEKEFGWKRAEIASGPTIVAVVGCLVAPFMGMAIDRYGARRIAIFGVIALCGAIAILSQAGPSIWSWWALWCLMAVTHPFIKPTVWVAAVTSLFTTGRGMALAVALCGTSVGTSLTPLLTHYLIQNYGWRGAYMGLGAIWLMVTLPLVLFGFYSIADTRRRTRMRDPEQAKPPELPGLTKQEAMRSIKFAKIAGATAAISAATTALGMNLVPILSEAGIERGEAAAVAGVSGIAGITGKLSGGYLIDRYNASRVVGIATACPAISALLLLFLPGSIPAAIAAVAIVGLALGIEFDGVGYLASRHFGLKHFGLIYGTMVGLLALTSGVAPLLANYAFDVSGTYAALLWSIIPVAIISAVLFATLGSYPDFAKPEGDGAQAA